MDSMLSMVTHRQIYLTDGQPAVVNGDTETDRFTSQMDSMLLSMMTHRHVYLTDGQHVVNDDT